MIGCQDWLWSNIKDQGHEHSSPACLPKVPSCGDRAGNRNKSNTGNMAPTLMFEHSSMTVFSLISSAFLFSSISTLCLAWFVSQLLCFYSVPLSLSAFSSLDALVNMINSTAVSSSPPLFQMITPVSGCRPWRGNRAPITLMQITLM